MSECVGVWECLSLGFECHMERERERDKGSYHCVIMRSRTKTTVVLRQKFDDMDVTSGCGVLRHVELLRAILLKPHERLKVTRKDCSLCCLALLIKAARRVLAAEPR